MDLGWAAVIQAVLIALSTWYVRKGSQDDARRVAKLTAGQDTADDILTRVKTLEHDLSLVKRLMARDTSIDHRGPKRS